jgi:NAD(P)-dependent dehydrogenase (short-subunit alcohol dehydrogenase family)
MSKSIMIIGAGPGIGQAVAQKFGREGWQVVLTGRHAERLAGLVAELQAEGIIAHAIPADATDPAALRAAVAQADALTGGLTVVHFNAGVVRNQDLFSMTDTEIASDLAIDVAAGFNTIRAATELFGARGGTILVTGGGLGTNPSADWAVLGAGKAALRNMVQGLAGPLVARGIRIRIATVATLVGPGSEEARGAADVFWALATDPNAAWEAVYPRPTVGPTPLTLIARLTARPEQADALGEELKALIAPTLGEAGALAYRLHRDDDDPDVWILYETWASRADLDAHFAQPYTRAVMDRFPQLLAREMELSFATEIGAQG